MRESSRRDLREKRTVRAMISIYCHAHHEGDAELCVECRRLDEYAGSRIDRCPYRLRKPTCASCPIHCWSAESRRRIRDVMRFSGPRMLLRHPVLALLHAADGLRPAPRPPVSRGTGQA